MPNDSKTSRRRAFAKNMGRAKTFPLLGLILLGSVAIGLPACKDDGGVEEAMEEIQDEAKDLKDEVKDEIDDHS